MMSENADGFVGVKMTTQQYRTIREQIGTQKEVAEMLGLSRLTIARREAGECRITKEAEIALKWIRGKLNS